MLRVYSFKELVAKVAAIIVAVFGVFTVAKVGVVRMIAPTIADRIHKGIDIIWQILAYVILIGAFLAICYMCWNYWRNRRKTRELSPEAQSIKDLSDKMVEGNESIIAEIKALRNELRNMGNSKEGESDVRSIANHD